MTDKYQDEFEAKCHLDKFTQTLAGQIVDINRKENSLTYKVKKSLGFIGNNKFDWKPNCHYLGINEEIMRMLIRNNLRLRVILKGKAYFMPKEIVKESFEKSWIVKEINCLKIYAIPFRKAEPERKMVRKQFKTSLDNFCGIADAVA
jgi:hypothetical protein